MNLRHFAIIILAFIYSPPSLHAQENHLDVVRKNWDPISCYQAVGQLSPYYRGHMEMECFIWPVRLCSEETDVGKCLENASEKTKDFISQARSRLPPTSPAKGLLAIHYNRSLRNIALPAPKDPGCRDQPHADNAICEFLDLLGPVMSAFSAARMAGVEDGFRPENRLILPENEISSDLNPINCLAILVSLGDVYRGMLSLDCTTLGMKVCNYGDMDTDCMESHISAMRAFAASTQAKLADSISANTENWGHYAHDLEYLTMSTQEQPLDIDQCPHGFELAQCASMQEYVRMSIATEDLLRIAYDMDPNLLAELVNR